MKNKAHDTIRDAIEQGYGGLAGDEYLAGRIITKRSGLHFGSLRTVVVVAVMLIVMTGVALALVPRKLAVEKYGVWSYVDGQILYQATEAKRPEVVLEKEGIRFMAADSGTNTLYYITKPDGGDYLLESISTYGMAMTPGRTIKKTYRIEDIAISGSMLYMQAFSQGAARIFRIHTYSDEIQDEMLSAEGWQNKYITSFAVDENILYTYSAQTKLLSAVDISASRKVLETPVEVEGISSITAGYVEDGVHYVFAVYNGSRLVAVSTRTGEISDTGVKLPADATALARDNYNLYVIDSVGEMAASFDVTDLSGRGELKQLYIVDAFEGSAVFDTAERLFYERYPDVEIVYRHTNGEIDYKTEMMSGESGIDIVCFQDYYTSFSPLPQLLKNGAILDITDEPAIAALREHYRDIWNLVSANGRQYGVMTLTVPTLWEVDAEIAAQIGWEIPEGVWTWAEFDELIDLVITYNETAETPIDLLMDQGGAGYAIEQFDSVYLDYFAGTTNYDSEEYLQLLARQQKLALNGLLYEDDPSVWERELDGNTLLRVDDHCVLAGMRQKTYILPPTFDAEDPAYVTSVMPLIINANTKMKEEAVYFLACYASVEATRRNYYLNDGQWLKDKELYEAPDPMTVAYLGGYPSEQNEYLFNFILEYSEPVLQIVEVWRTHYFELLPSLNAGEITPEEYASIVQKQADMILGE